MNNNNEQNIQDYMQFRKRQHFCETILVFLEHFTVLLSNHSIFRIFLLFLESQHHVLRAILRNQITKQKSNKKKKTITKVNWLLPPIPTVHKTCIL